MFASSTLLARVRTLHEYSRVDRLGRTAEHKMILCFVKVETKDSAPVYKAPPIPSPFQQRPSRSMHSRGKEALAKASGLNRI